MIDDGLINKIKADTISEFISRFEEPEDTSGVMYNWLKRESILFVSNLGETNTVATPEEYVNYHRYKEALMQIRAMKKGSVPERILELVNSTLNQPTK